MKKIITMKVDTIKSVAEASGANKIAIFYDVEEDRTDIEWFYEEDEEEQGCDAANG